LVLAILLKKINKENQEKSNFSNDNPSKNTLSAKKLHIVRWTIFLFTLSIVLISLISVIFPALIASNNSIIKALEEIGIQVADIDPFVLGVWSTSLIVVNLMVFTLTILFFKKKLPDFILKPIEFIFSFEVSKKVAFIVIAIILGLYVGFSAGELTIVEEWEDYPGVKNRLDNWSPNQITTSFEPHVKYFLHWSSMILFGSYAVIPFIASISLLVVVYFITYQISKKRFAGIVAMVILLQSNVFLSYDSSVSYSNFWILFFLLSLYLIYKFWPISPVFYFLSILSKPLTVFFLPMLLVFIYRSSISKNRKIVLSILSSAIIIIGITFFYTNEIEGTRDLSSREDFNEDSFWLGFTSISYQLRYDGLILLFMLPLVVGLFIASKNGFKQADSIMFLVGWTLLSAPILTGFSELTNQPYRFVPLIVFFALGVGTLLSKRINSKN